MCLRSMAKICASFRYQSRLDRGQRVARNRRAVILNQDDDAALREVECERLTQRHVEVATELDDRSSVLHTNREDKTKY